MPNSQVKKGLYTLRFNRLRFAYELTDCAIVISAIIRPSILQSQPDMPLHMNQFRLMSRTFPGFFKELFDITAHWIVNQIAEDKIEASITIRPKNNAEGVVHGPLIKNDDIISMHEAFMNELNLNYDPVVMQWLGDLSQPLVQAVI